MKKIGVKSLLNVLYATIILLPMFSIFGRLIYTQANPNAKDSYSTSVIENNTKITSNDYVDYTLYTFSYNQPSTHTGVRSPFTYISLTYNDLGVSQDVFNTLTHILLYSNNKIYFSNDDNTNRYDYDLTNDIFKSFAMRTIYQSYLTDVFDVYFTTFSTGTLDNAFEYSIKSFTDDNNFGNVDFFGWFTNLFLNQSSTKNALYLNFVNWYLNYTLLVSSGYLLFLALIWFINYVRKILDKSMYHDFGGY